MAKDGSGVGTNTGRKIEEKKTVKWNWIGNRSPLIGNKVGGGVGFGEADEDFKEGVRGDAQRGDGWQRGLGAGTEDGRPGAVVEGKVS